MALQSLTGNVEVETEFSIITEAGISSFENLEKSFWELSSSASSWKALASLEMLSIWVSMVKPPENSSLRKKLFLRKYICFLTKFHFVEKYRVKQTDGDRVYQSQEFSSLNSFADLIQFLSWIKTNVKFPFASYREVHNNFHNFSRKHTKHIHKIKIGTTEKWNMKICTLVGSISHGLLWVPPTNALDSVLFTKRFPGLHFWGADRSFCRLVDSFGNIWAQSRLRDKWVWT